INKGFQSVCQETDVLFTFGILCYGVGVQNVLADAVLMAVCNSNDDEVAPSVCSQNRHFPINLPVAERRTFMKKVLSILQIKYGVAAVCFIVIVRQQRPYFACFVQLRYRELFTDEFNNRKKLILERSPVCAPLLHHVIGFIAF